MATEVYQFGGVPVVPNTFLFNTWFGHPNGQVGIFGVHFRINTVSGAGSAKMGDLALAYLDYIIGNSILNCFATPITLEGVKVSDVDTVNPPLAGIASSDEVGASGAAVMPTQVSSIVAWHTQFGGPRFRGRAYIPFPSESDNAVGGLPEDDHLIQLGNFASAIVTLNGLTVGGQVFSCIPVIHHPDLIGTARYTTITDFVVPRKWATQKRRGSYGKTNSTLTGA